ncbi:MAG: type II toxin-antitoxin system VapC family toxin [Dehalococcoidia bacterium]
MTPANDAAVLDASVASKWYLPDERDIEQARQALDAFDHGHVAFIAPQHIEYEVVSAITVASRGAAKRITDAEAELSIARFLALGIPTVADDDLLMAAHLVARQTGCAFYDGLYVALAQRLGLPLLTADWKLYQNLYQLGELQWIGAWTPPA